MSNIETHAINTVLRRYAGPNVEYQLGKSRATLHRVHTAGAMCVSVALAQEAVIEAMQVHEATLKGCNMKWIVRPSRAPLQPLMQRRRPN